MSWRMSRRKFVQATSAALLGPTIISSLAGGEETPANERINLGFIGVGYMSRGHLQRFLGYQDVQVIAVCDVSTERREHGKTLADAKYSEQKSKGSYKGCATFNDFRELLEVPGLDAVVIGTPDHNHALITLAALKAGKHVYCEKPLTRTVREARLVAEAAARSGLATQMGNQGMAFEGNRALKEWLADDAIGPVHEVHVWSDRPTSKGTAKLWWPQGIEKPTDTPPVPDGLDWNLWLGPAPHRPYHPAYAPFRWRGWWDFGSGGLGDMGIHNLAPVFDALRLGAPTAVHGSSTPVLPDSVPAACVVHYEFPARVGMPKVTLHWYDGGLMPPRPAELEPDEELDREDGILFVGGKGKMLVEGWGGRVPRLLPDSLMRAYQRPPKTLPRSIGHYREFIQACKEGTLTASHFGFAGPLTEAVLLGMVCIRTGGRRLLWDPVKLETNLPEANAYLHYPYRTGWTL